MALWDNLGNKNSAPVHIATEGYGGQTPQVTGNGQIYFANNVVAAFQNAAAIGVFAVTPVKQAAAAENDTDVFEDRQTGLAPRGEPQHAGWIIRQMGTGPIESIGTFDSGDSAGGDSPIPDEVITSGNTGIGLPGANGFITILVVLAVV